MYFICSKCPYNTLPKSGLKSKLPTISWLFFCSWNLPSNLRRAECKDFSLWKIPALTTLEIRDVFWPFQTKFSTNSSCPHEPWGTEAHRNIQIICLTVFGSILIHFAWDFRQRFKLVHFFWTNFLLTISTFHSLDFGIHYFFKTSLCWLWRINFSDYLVDK